MGNSVNIAVTGKGGTGKSTISALILKALVEKQRQLILAIDADPNYNLYSKLGMEVGKTIGDLREEMRKSGDETPAGMSKSQFVEYQLRILLVEGDRFDLLTMGRQEGPGCYCYINNVLRHFMDTLSTSYPYIIIDNDAGMEHLSRRTDQHMDFLLIATDPTKVGIETAGRIRSMALEMELVHGKVILLVNGVIGKIPDYLDDVLAELSFENVHAISRDDALFELNARGEPIFDIAADSPAYVDVKEIVELYGIRP